MGHPHFGSEHFVYGGSLKDFRALVNSPFRCALSFIVVYWRKSCKCVFKGECV